MKCLGSFWSQNINKIKFVPNHWLNRETREPKHYPEWFGVKHWICNDPLSNRVNQWIAQVNLFNVWTKEKKYTMCICEKTQKYNEAIGL